MKDMKICNRCLVNKDPVPQGKAHPGCKFTPDTKKADRKEGIVRYHTCKEEECLESFLLCDSPVHMVKNQEKTEWQLDEILAVYNKPLLIYFFKTSKFDYISSKIL